MNESLEKRIFKLAQVFKNNEKRPESVLNIYTKMKKYVPYKLFNEKVNSKFIELEIEIYKNTRDLYKKHGQY